MLYPPIEPFAHGMLAVGDGHQLYWEQCGSPKGLPVVFLHGGPGGACSATSRRFFDPQRYRIVLFDQRGCGRSLPHASTAANSCAHLVADMERLRLHLNIDRWVLCGGSWGTTLAMAYTRRHRMQVIGLVLRGVFAARQWELDWLYRPGGASRVFPEAWQAFANALGPVNPHKLLTAYEQALHGDDPRRQALAAQAWCRWEETLAAVQERGDTLAATPQEQLAMARISSHYFVHDAWLGERDLIWPEHGLDTLPCIMVQGQWDLVTPPETAWQLHQRWPGSELRMVPEAGHSTSDPALRQALVLALDDMAALCLAHSDQSHAFTPQDKETV